MPHVAGPLRHRLIGQRDDVAAGALGTSRSARIATARSALEREVEPFPGLERSRMPARMPRRPFAGLREDAAIDRACARDRRTSAVRPAACDGCDGLLHRAAPL